MSASSTEDRAKALRRAILSRALSFWAVAAIGLLAAAPNAAASPLYRIYQVQFRFSATTLTLLFAVYVVILLATLVFVGSASDYLGRRPVLLAALTLGAIACGLFLLAHGVGVLFAGRALQGISVGLISGTASAALLDLRPESSITPVVSGAAPSGGQALGAIGASALAEYAPAPTHLVWWLLIAAFVIGIVAMLRMPEPGTVRPGVVSSLRPHVTVPHRARRAFAAALPALVGVWALAGLYLSLGPSLALQLLHSENVLWGGVLVFLLTGFAAASSVAVAGKDPTGVMLFGCFTLIVGAVVTLASIATGTPAALFVAAAVAGLGFGSAFAGAYGATVARAASDERAGMITAMYIVSYLSTSIPAVIAGIATSHFGLQKTALVYCAAVALLAAVAVSLLIRQTASGGSRRASDHPDMPPGLGTIPPCPPASRRLGEASA